MYTPLYDSHKKLAKGEIKHDTDNSRSIALALTHVVVNLMWAAAPVEME